MDPTVSPDARPPVSGQAPASRLETVLQRRAKRLGIPVEEVRAHDRKALRASRAERIDCLDPYEVEQLYSGELAADRAEHLAQCVICSALVDVSRPSDQGFKRLMRSLAAEARLSVDVRPRKSIPQVLKELGLIELGVAGALAAGFLALMVFGQDNITATVVRETAPDSGRVILFMAIIAALLVCVAGKWLTPIVPSMRWIDGRAVGGAFVVFVTGYLAVTAWTLSAAQSSLVATIAKNAAGGQVFVNSVFTAQVPSLSGSLVAEKTTDAFRLYWEDADNSRLAVGTAYLGRLASGANGVKKLRAGGQDIDLKQTWVVQSADVGKRAVAVVPSNAARAAAFGLVD
jgi:hypothetical protein